MRLFFVLAFLFEIIASSQIFQKRNVILLQNDLHGILIREIKTSRELICIKECQQDKTCHYVLHKSSLCFLYSFYAKYFLHNSSDSVLFEKITHANFGLIHFWPIENGTARDLVGSKDLQEPYNTNFEPDRFGNNKSVLSLNNGYIKAPRGVYFEDEFTVLLWIKLRSYKSWQTLFHFSNGINVDSVSVAIPDWTRKKSFDVRDGFTILDIKSKQVLELNKWYHLGFWFRKGIMKIYTNSISIQQINSYPSNLNLSLQRRICCFGKSPWEDDLFGDFECDDIKFFNKALSTLDIQSEYLNGFF